MHGLAPTGQRLARKVSGMDARLTVTQVRGPHWTTSSVKGTLRGRPQELGWALGYEAIALPAVPAGHN